MLELNKIYLGDCLEVMQDIDDQSIDLILCDLPYGTTACKWDTIIPFDKLWGEYYRVIRPNGFIVLTASQPFTTKLINSNINQFSHQWIWEKEQGSNPLLANMMPMKNFEDIIVFYNGYNSDTYLDHPLRGYSSDLKKEIGLSISGINSKLGHRKAEHFFYINSTRYKLCTEEVYEELIETFGIDSYVCFNKYSEIRSVDDKYYSQYPRVYNPQMTKGEEYTSGGGYIKHLDSYVEGGTISEERYPTSIIKFQTDKNKSEHPTQKPVALFEYLIKTYTNEGDLVLDNCAGSGTTGIACLNTKRDYILIEKEEGYIKIIKDRIKEHNVQTTF